MDFLFIKSNKKHECYEKKSSIQPLSQFWADSYLTNVKLFPKGHFSSCRAFMERPKCGNSLLAWRICSTDSSKQHILLIINQEWQVKDDRRGRVELHLLLQLFTFSVTHDVFFKLLKVSGVIGFSFSFFRFVPRCDWLEELAGWHPHCVSSLSTLHTIGPPPAAAATRSASSHKPRKIAQTLPITSKRSGGALLGSLRATYGPQLSR